MNDRPPGEEVTKSSEEDQQFEALLEFLKGSRGFDFTGYKRSTLRRRIEKRMTEVGVPACPDYVSYLEANPGEFEILFNTILINVTSFFRDPEVWSFLRDKVLPEQLAAGNASAFRVWVAGCASGEEAYSIAMVLADILGMDGFRERVKIYATDVDSEALDLGRHGAYSKEDAEAIPERYRSAYIDTGEDTFTVRGDLRRVVIFGRNDLVGDAPISHIDLLLCRNTLMYFNLELQRQIHSRLHFALADSGVLVLGRSEMLTGTGAPFTPVDLKTRVFRKVPSPTLRDRLMKAAQVADLADDESPESLVRIRYSALEHSPIAQLVIDRDGVVVLANNVARTEFGLAVTDLGRPLKDLSVALRPADLPSALDRAYVQRAPIRIEAAPWRTGDGDERRYETLVAPLTAPDGTLLGATVSFHDVTEYGDLRTELEQSQSDLQRAYGELQSTVEELETTNEELQSTNEELETTNEELQSTNEELETINDELTLRSGELEQVTGFMESILASIGRGVIVLDTNQEVMVWNTTVERWWGMTAAEAEGQHFMGLEIGLSVDKLRKPIHAVLEGGEEGEHTTLSAQDRSGREMRCDVSLAPLRASADGPGGVILLIDEVGDRKRR